MLWGEGDIWKEEKGKSEGKRGERKEERLNDTEECSRNDRSCLPIPTENRPGKLLGEVLVRVSTSEDRKSSRFGWRIMVNKHLFGPRLKI